MLARRLPGILPPLGHEEALEVTRIHSVAGLLPPGRPLIRVPPFRAPHHSASMAAIVGGGSGPRPGEASLAHRGVLLLDELPEFQRPALEALRQPLEDGVDQHRARRGTRASSRRASSSSATMNLCPCGARGDPAAECACSPQRLARYRDKLSRALLDRFDLVVTVPRPRAQELAGSAGRARPTPSPSVSSPRVSGSSAAPPPRDPRRPMICSTARSSGCRCRAAAAPASRVWRATIAALAARESVAPSTSPRRSSYRSPTELAA